MKRILWTTVRPELQTWANLVTLLRLALGLVAFGAALATDRQVWNFVALAIYWGGDLLDGFLARRLRQETIFGAEFDILADRLLVSLFYTCYVSAHPEKLVVGLLFLFEFMVLDHFLSNQFVRWPIASPNYFHLVDRLTWKWLWSRPGKAMNTGLVTLLTIGLPTPWPAACAVLGLIGVRVYFFLRVLVLSADAREVGRAAVASAPNTPPDGHHDRRLLGVRIKEVDRQPALRRASFVT
jgi:CDP-diacylglycerol--glycerol-3-phosphate 3-phosphatidyltransferase